jgi:hypothetical protein
MLTAESSGGVGAIVAMGISTDGNEFRRMWEGKLMRTEEAESRLEERGSSYLLREKCRVLLYA